MHSLGEAMVGLGCIVLLLCLIGIIYVRSWTEYPPFIGDLRPKDSRDPYDSDHDYHY